MDDNNYESILIGEKHLRIDDNKVIISKLYQKRLLNYYEFYLNNNNKEIFLGKFIKKYNPINALYKDNKILIYEYESNISKDNIANDEITEILSLYNVEDDILYSCTQEKALNIFDQNIDSKKLVKRNKQISIK